ncbi:MAG: hypothetical protein E7072_03275 [Bacteroidales bacterium]|nr:hypothetical protein [Bacteroidales bacterium]
MKKMLVTLLLATMALQLLAQPTPWRSPSTGKWGFKEGNTWVVKPIYEDYDKANAYKNRKYAVVKLDGKWGAIDLKGNYLSKAVFPTSAIALKAAKAAVAKGAKNTFLYEMYDVTYKKWGFVDYTGEMYFRPIYEEVDVANSFMKPGNPLCIVKLDGQWGCLDREGVMAINPYFTSKEEALKAANEFKAKAVVGENIYIGLRGNVKKIGFINYLGNWVMKPVFENVDKSAMFGPSTYFAVVKYKGKWAAIDRGGNFVVKPIHPTAAAAKTAAVAWQSKNPNAKVAATAVPNLESFTYKTPNLAAQAVTENQAPKKQETTVPSKPTTPSVPSNPPAPTVKKAGVPTIKIISPKSGTHYSSPEVTFVYETSTYDGSDPEIIAYVNGELQPRTKGVRQVGKLLTLTLPRVADCRVQLIAKDNKGQNSDPAVVLLHYRGDRPKPALHVFAVGISDYDQADLKLQHAAKDAADFMNTVKACNLSQYSSLKTANLVQDKAGTDKNIKKGLSSLVNSVQQGDVALLFFSGHGAKEGAETYFLSSNAESNDLFSSAVDFDIIKSALKRLKDRKCRIIIFMDACHSGSMYGVKSVTETFSMAEPGVIGFYSSTEAQKSNESEQWENGIFTKALLEGLKGAAVDQEGNITLDALELYIREQVRKATGGRQMPIFENRQGNYILFEKK